MGNPAHFHQPDQTLLVPSLVFDLSSVVGMCEVPELPALTTAWEHQGDSS